LWFSDDEDIANDFADNFYDDMDNIKIIYNVEINSSDIADISYELSKEIVDFYGYDDFRECIPMLQEKGFDGWFTTGSIGSKIYDDIAIFDEDVFFIKECKMFIDGEWTDYITLNEAEKTYNIWFEKKGN